ncbi:MAG: glycosyltransferase [Rubrivivax sp.]|nr:glycosyltransferase [Rubrivivax sp.]
MDKFPSRARATAAALEPRVSAVVAVRGVGPGGWTALELCLRSALAEPWIDDVVIVDQGNAPSISSSLRALQLDRRDVLVASAHANAGYAAAANLGAAKARGRWLLFLDPDVVLQRGGRQVAVPMPARLITNDSGAVLAAGLDGLGIVQIAEFVAAHHLASGALLRVLPAWQCPALPLHLLTPGTRHRPARVQVFIDWVQGVLARRLAG